MKITFKAKIFVDRPEHTDLHDIGTHFKYPYLLTLAETKRLLDEDLLKVEMILPFDNEPVFIFKLKNEKKT